MIQVVRHVDTFSEIRIEVNFVFLIPDIDVIGRIKAAFIRNFVNIQVTKCVQLAILKKDLIAAVSL